MVDFKRLADREVKSKKLILKLEVELSNSLLTAEEAADRLNAMIKMCRFREFDNLVVALLRETKSNMWDMKNLEIVSE